MPKNFWTNSGGQNRPESKPRSGVNTLFNNGRSGFCGAGAGADAGFVGVEGRSPLTGEGTVAALTGAGVGALTVDAVGGLTGAGVGALTGAGVEALTGASVEALTGDGVEALTGAGVGALTGAGVEALTGAGVGALTGAGVGALTGAGAGALTGAAIGAAPVDGEDAGTCGLAGARDDGDATTGALVGALVGAIDAQYSVYSSRHSMARRRCIFRDT
jgi:hypothetical protein